MIKIEERVSHKVVGCTSLFVSFNYKPQYVDIVKSCSGSNYDKKFKTWEIPITYLSKLIDEFCTYESIELNLQKENSIEVDYSSLKLKQYKIEPFDYQIDGIKYGLCHKNWLLLDPPGLGKSKMIIHIAEELKDREGISHCLVICGLNTLKENWKMEIAKHCNLSSRILGERVTRTGRVRIGSVSDRLEQLKHPIDEFFVITNVETLRNTEIVKNICSGCNHFDMIVVDEIHRCKSSTSQQGENLLKLCNANYKIGATGTLLLNNPLDAYVPLKWIGAENCIYTNFKNFYCTFRGSSHNIITGFKNIDVLKDTISKYSLRRSKDILKLPPKTIINEYVDMDDKQRTFYENIANDIVEQVDKVDLGEMTVLSMATRLRQATACPSILTSEDICSAKIDRACDLVEQIVSNGDKVVIFSTFKQTAYTLKNLLQKYNPVVSTGDVKDTVIAENVSKFQTDPNIQCFIATWQQCGTGLTLTAASYVIFIDVPWTNAAYEQAQDRCYRIGTSKNVTIYHLITRGTIDERVLEIVEDKLAISDYVLDDAVTKSGLESLVKYIRDLKNYI